jgi:hypothetical protein
MVSGLNFLNTNALIMQKKMVAVHHLMVGLLLLTKGVDKIQHHHSFIGWTILLFGLIILFYFIFLQRTKRPHAKLEIIIHLFECIALCFTTYVYFKEGKNFLPYVTMAASIGFFVATLVHLKAFFKERHSRQIFQRFAESFRFDSSFSHSDKNIHLALTSLFILYLIHIPILCSLRF